LRKFLPVLRIWRFRRLKFNGYDLVISSSGAEAKGIKVREPTIHLDYCHAPTHYYWSRYSEYMARPGFGIFNPLARFGLRVLVGPLRRWDYRAAQRPDYMLANSTYIKQQVQRYYDRSAVVVYPPVHTEQFKKWATNTKRRGFVIAGRQTPYKRFDLAVAACTKLGLPLTVIGDGPEHRRLRRMAGPTITFLGRVSDEILAEEFGRAKALFFPGLDDFGITAVEAMAAGTPVIAYKAGGALDYVIPGKTGVFFESQTITSLVGALKQFRAQQFNALAISRSAENYSVQRFKHKMNVIIKKILQGRSRDI
jgi:glycosyltransferase involved in cell wall biosynthesis